MNPREIAALKGEILADVAKLISVKFSVTTELSADPKIALVQTLDAVNSLKSDLTRDIKIIRDIVSSLDLRVTTIETHMLSSSIETEKKFDGLNASTSKFIDFIDGDNTKKELGVVATTLSSVVPRVIALEKKLTLIEQKGLPVAATPGPPEPTRLIQPEVVAIQQPVASMAPPKLDLKMLNRIEHIDNKINELEGKVAQVRQDFSNQGDQLKALHETSIICVSAVSALSDDFKKIDLHPLETRVEKLEARPLFLSPAVVSEVVPIIVPVVDIPLLKTDLVMTPVPEQSPTATLPFPAPVPIIAAPVEIEDPENEPIEKSGQSHLIKAQIQQPVITVAPVATAVVASVPVQAPVFAQAAASTPVAFGGPVPFSFGTMPVQTQGGFGFGSMPVQSQQQQQTFFQPQQHGH